MWILPLVGYLGLLFGFAFLTLAIASGLYYLSELVEEHTVPAKKFLTRLIYGVVSVQVLLTLVDGLPWLTSVLSIGSHVIYLQNLRFFPIVRLSDPVFIVSCFLVLLNHYLWFLHFSSPPTIRNASRWDSAPTPLPSFTEIASFFFLQVWLVPFSLFVSLSASENVLPSMGSEYATDRGSTLLNAAGGAGGAGVGDVGGAAGSGSRGRAGRSSSALGLGGMGNLLSARGSSSSGGGSSNAWNSNQVQQGSLGLDAGREGRRKGGAKGLARVAVDGVREWMGETGEAFGLWKGESTRRW